MRNFVRNVVRTFIIAIVFTAIIPIKAAYAETMEEQLNNLIGPKQQYSTMLSSAYLRNNESETSVSPQSGDMTLTQTDYVLPGRNGLDLEIKRIYKSGISNVHEMKTYWNGGAWVDYLQSDATTSSFYEDRYNLGVGWRFSFPTIENRQNSDGSSFKYLHTESGDVYRLNNPTWDGNTYVYSLENHTVKDVEIKETIDVTKKFSNGQSDGISRYVMIEKNGKKTYFADDGRILGEVDRYGNTITFEYMTLTYYIRDSIYNINYTKTKRLISKITDTVGRQVLFDYYEGVKNPDGSFEAKFTDASSKFQVNIYLPDNTPEDITNNKKLTYLKSAMLVTWDRLYTIRTRLIQETDIDGIGRYGYSYEHLGFGEGYPAGLGFTFGNGTYYSVYNVYENLNQIDYFKTNRLKRFFYGTYTKSLGSSGSMQYRKVIEEQDLAKTGYDSSKTNDFDKYLCDLKNKETYTYTNEPDGFAYSGYNPYDQNYLKNTYRYYTEATDMRGAKTKYTYDGLGEAVNVEDYGNDHKEVSTTTYDANKLPNRTEKLIYNVVNGQVSGTPVKNVEDFVYDAYGNLTQYSGASGRDANGNLTGNTYTTPEGTVVNEHTVVYTYATDRYHILTSKTWKKDASTTSRIEYTVASNGNVTQEKRVHTESGSDKSVITDYLYDSYGNMTKKTLHYSDNTGNTYVTNYEYGIDADGVDQKGAYLTKEYSTVDGTEVSTKYTYDFYTGNKKADIDAKANRTGYSYDSVERLTKITYPDNTNKQYSYYDNYYSDCEIAYTDQLSKIFYYTYNIFGNLVKYRGGNYINGQWQNSTFMQIQYDSNGNILKEIDGNGHSTRFSYDSANRLISKSFWENDTTQKKSMSLAYSVGYDSSTPLLLTVTDEEGYIKKYHYDILDRLISVDATPDKTNFYATAYTYDYAGNKTSIKDGRNNTTNYTYDDLDRLVKQVDPLTYSTTYVYDAGDNFVQQINAKNVSTYYEYDQLGRLIREKVPASDGSTATTRYIYDANGNKIKEITPNYYNSAKDTSALVNTMTGLSYIYDNMDRLISTLSPEGIIIEYRKYDGNGNLKKVVDGLRYNGNVDTSLGTTYYYDVFGREIQVTDTSGNNVYYQYDAVENMTKKTDARSYQTLYTYNPDRTLAKVTYPDTGYIEYTYDKLGNVLTQKDQLGNVTTYSYDGFGRVLSLLDPYNNTIVNQYDPNSNLINTKDKRGNYTYFTYDANNKLTQKKVPLELDGTSNIVYAIENYTYDGLGNITKKSLTGTKDASSFRDTNYTYYDNNLVNTVSDNSGGYVKNYYDKNGNKTKVETLRSSGVYDVNKYEYDNRDRIVKNISLVEETSIYNAGNLPNITAIRDSEYSGRVQLITGYEYDILGNKTKVIDPRAYGYLATDTVNRAKYSNGYSYDILNRLEKITWKYNGADVYKQYYYDANSNKIKERNERGYFTEYTFDSVNRLKTIKDALAQTTTYNYDLAGNKISEINAKTDSVTYSYDKLNRLVTVTDPYNVVILKNIYDGNGNVIKKVDAKGYLSGSTDDTRYGTVYTYDFANRLIKVVDPEITALNDSSKYTSKYEYNQYGQKTKDINALGNATQYLYDNAGRLTKVTDALNIATQYTYDYAGNMLTMIDGRGKVTQRSHGSFGILVSITNAENKVAANKYDLVLNKVQMVDRNGNETTYTYDMRNLLLSRSVTQTGDSVSYTYDETGNRASMNDATGTSTYSYDTVNRLISIKLGGVTQLSYTYDTIGNILTVTDKKAFVTTYTYDKSSRMKTVSYTISGTSKTTTYNYDENGNRTSILYDGGVKEEYTYDKNNRLKTLLNKKPDGSTISSYTYAYDLAGQQTSKIDSYGTTNYTYDNDGRIQKVEMPGKTTIYAYDNAGNRISLSETYTSDQGSGYIDQSSGNEIKYKIKSSDYIYSDANMLLKLVVHMKDSIGTEVLQKTTNYFYDNNGNQTQETNEYVKATVPGTQEIFNVSAYDDSTTTFDGEAEIATNYYDGFNRLTKVEAIKAGTRAITEFAYDGNDLRTKKTVKRSSTGYTPEVTNYLYDRQYVILETDASDSLKTRYIKGINYIARVDAANMHSYFMYNGHGDVIQTVSEAGVVENQYNYDIFGSPILAVEVYPCAIRYAGEFYDSETGLYYLNARYYDSKIARFICEDTYRGKANDPLSLNLYTYVSNNPIKYTDPTGHYQKGDEKLPQAIQDQLAVYGRQWQVGQASNDKKLMDSAHQKADELRAKYVFTEYKGSSVVDYLNLVGVDSSKSNLKDIASDTGIKNYTGTASQNTQILNSLTGKKDTLASKNGISSYTGTTAQDAKLYQDIYGKKPTNVLTTAAMGKYNPAIYMASGTVIINSQKVGTGDVGNFSNIKGGTIDDVLARIPSNANNIGFKTTTRISDGFQYSWKDENGVNWTVRTHAQDSGAPQGSNSSQGWTVRVQRGNEYLTSKGEWVTNKNATEQQWNDSHIPIQTPQKDEDKKDDDNNTPPTGATGGDSGSSGSSDYVPDDGYHPYNPMLPWMPPGGGELPPIELPEIPPIPIFGW